MLREVRFSAKRLPTFEAVIRLFSCVNSLMIMKGGTRGERFPTFIALIRPFSRVNSQMIIETRDSSKSFPTFVALIRVEEWRSG